MVRSLLKGSLSLIGAAVVLYVTFFVPLGSRTLAEHIARISATEEAQDLGTDVRRASDRLEHEVRDRIPLDDDGRTDAGQLRP